MDSLSSDDVFLEIILVFSRVDTSIPRMELVNWSWKIVCSQGRRKECSDVTVLATEKLFSYILKVEAL